MVRRLDREIESWSRRSARDQLSLLWDEQRRDSVKVISWWEGDEWGSSYVISASEPKPLLAGKWWAVCFVEFGQPELDQMVLSDESESAVELEVASDAREIRRLLEIPGIEERPELTRLLVTLGVRRDEIDIPTIMKFMGHRDRVVRYVTLGILSWQPSITNDDLLIRFGSDPDPRVSDLAKRFATGRLRRRTRK